MKDSEQHQYHAHQLGRGKNPSYSFLLVAVPLFDKPEESIKNQADCSRKSHSDTGGAPQSEHNREDEQSVERGVDLSGVESLSFNQVLSHSFHARVHIMDMKRRSCLFSIAASVEQTAYSAKEVIEHQACEGRVKPKAERLFAKDVEQAA